MEDRYKIVLSIAGSDSIGGAGIQADIKTCCSIGVYAMTAITAVTAQNSTGVKGYEATSPELMRLQLNTILSDVTPDVVKIGMLPDTTTAEIVADTLIKYNLKKIVTDPVMVATSGHSLSGAGVKQVLLNRIIPLSTIVTPNIPETIELTSLSLNNFDDIVEAGRILSEKFPYTSFLIKGGHCPENDSITDVLFTEKKVKISTHPYIKTNNTHGTGCSLSSAIASYMALGHELAEAVNFALEWESEAIEAGASMKFGSPDGHGPINHLFKK